MDSELIITSWEWDLATVIDCSLQKKKKQTKKQLNDHHGEKTYRTNTKLCVIR